MCESLEHLGLALFVSSRYRAAVAHPAFESVLDVLSIKPHLLKCRHRQCRSPTRRTMENETFRFSKDISEIWTIRVDPELDHSAWCVYRVGYEAFSLPLADIPNVDDNDLAIVMEIDSR